MTQFLTDIANRRKRDPLAPVTVIVPSHVAGLQLRRRLAEAGAFANVRFETLPRIAELLGAGDLARAGRKPLARPIGDFVAAQVAREARQDLATVRDLPGFARVLRYTFSRLRRGGFRRAEDVPVRLRSSSTLREVVRLFGEFRSRTGQFYDTEDLLDAAASNVARHRENTAKSLGEIYVVPPGALTAASDRLLAELKKAVGGTNFHAVPERESHPATRMVIAPDPTSEVREVVREVLAAIEAGYGLQEIAVYHGGNPAYPDLLARAFRGANVPFASFPGTRLSETVTGKAVLSLAELPLVDFARTATIDWLSLAPLRTRIPGENQPVPVAYSRWREVSRKAGITRGRRGWLSGLDYLVEDFRRDLARNPDDERVAERIARATETVAELREVFEALSSRLLALRESQPAAGFIAKFLTLIEDYIDPRAPSFDAVKAQVEQLGTIDAVGGTIDLASFVLALRANMEASYQRSASLGDGVFMSDYRLAPGLRFAVAIKCGSIEGHSIDSEPLIQDPEWVQWKETHPFIEDTNARLERLGAAARSSILSASESLIWTSPLLDGPGGRELYPSVAMVAAARAHDASIQNASALRRAKPESWLRKPPSPLAAMLTGRVLDLTELRVRDSMLARREGRSFAGHAVAASLDLLYARRGAEFSAFDGNLSELASDSLIPSGAVSPTSLEHYGACGFRYFLRSVLHLHPPEEPEDRETIDPLEKGNFVHNTLDDFFKAMAARNRPAVGEAWTEADRAELLALLESRLDESEARGRTGLRVFSDHERRRLRADLVAFLEHDTQFRLETGARPTHFEVPLPNDAPLIAGLRMRGYVDRIDVTEDGKHAWVIDYKTGSMKSYEGMKDGANPLADGTKLQLPVYLAAVPDAETVEPLYWFISSAGGFTRLPFATTADNMQRYEQTLGAILDGIKHGAFPAVPAEWNDFYGAWDNCQWCDFARLCSRRRDNEFADKQDHPHLQPWRRVGVTARGEVLP